MTFALAAALLAPTSALATTGGTADTGSSLVEESFVAEAPRVDVLFVIDNSCSMAVHAQAMADGLPTWFDAVVASGIDFHVGVTTTDFAASAGCQPLGTPLNGQLRPFGAERWIDPTTPSGGTTFAQLVDVGTDGAACERGLSAGYAAITQRPENLGFHREGVPLHTIFVSDGEDQSNQGPRPLNAQVYANWYTTLPQTSAIHTVTCANAVAPCGAQVGQRYQQMRDATGGVGVSILHPSTWTGLSDAVLVDPDDTFVLAQEADESSLSVLIERVDGTIDDASFAYDSATLTVTLSGAELQAGDEVLITYEPA